MKIIKTRILINNNSYKYRKWNKKILKINCESWQHWQSVVWQAKPPYAKRALERMCKQYGVTLEQVMQDEKKKYRFKVGRNPILRQLFEQCYAVVLETAEIGYWAPTRDTIVIELTALQYADLMNMWKWHQANFEKDMDEVRKTMFRAYIDKHGLYAPSDGTEEHVLTPEEKERILKAMLMSETLGDERYQKMLTNSRK